MGSQNECRQCGTCCDKGGPALHSRDLILIKEGLLSPKQLITIRKGEFSHDPVTDSIKPVKTELVKIKGAKETWRCHFYSRIKNGCTIYDHRPHECKVLKCWDTDGILDLAGKDLLSRLDIVEESNPLRAVIMDHEQKFPCPDLTLFSKKIPHASQKKIVKPLEQLTGGDLAYRMAAVKRYHLSVDEELFYFGRPLFQLLQAIGFMVRETPSGIRLKFKK